MAAVQSMSTFVFPERPQKTSSTPSENAPAAPHDSPTATSNHHTSSSSASSSSVLQVSSGFSSSLSDSGYLNLNFTTVPSSNQATSSSSDLGTLDSLDKDEYYSQSKATYSSASVNYNPNFTIPPEDFNATIRDESESQSEQPSSQPFVPPPQHPRNRHSRHSSTYNIDSTDIFDSLNASNPVQEAYRCLTTPSALHPSPSLAPNPGSFGNRTNQRQSSCSSPSKSFKQQHQSQPSLPQFLQKPFRNSQQQSLPNSLNPPSQQQFQQHLPIRTSSPILTCVPVEALIQLDILYSSSMSNATDAAARLIQLLIYYNVVNRLQTSTQAFHILLSDRLKSDPAKFSSLYLQSVDFCSSILKNDFTNRGSNFMSSLKSSNRRLLNSFLYLVKTSPSFICASLSTMNENDISVFFAPSSNDPFEDLAALHRANALDIIFYSLFPPTAPPSQRFDYFAFIIAFILDHFLTEKFDKLCLAIMDRILALSSKNHLSSFENILLGFLQNGQFLLKPNLPAFSLHSSTPILNHIQLGSPSTPQSSTMPCTSSAPTSTYPSPEMPAMSLAMNSPTNVLIPQFSSTTASISPTISLQRATAKPTTSTTTHNHNCKANSNFYHTVDTEFETKQLNFLNDAVSQFLSRLNNSSTEAIPEHLIHFSKIVLSKVSDQNKDHALYFIFFKHFLGKYIFSFFNSPESLSMAADFFISEKQRQRILLVIYQTLFIYAEIVILNKPSNTSVPPEIQTVLMSIYEKFSSASISATATSTNTTASIIQPSELDEDGSEASNGDFLNSIDGMASGTKDYSGQLLVLCPSDILTLYASLFPTFALQRKTSFASHNSATAKPISVERSGSSMSGHAVNRSSSSSFGFTAGSAPSTIGGGSGSGGPAHNPLNESLPSLDEINLYFPEDGSSTKSTPIFGPENELFEWNLNDIRLDIEPVAEELLKKFPYLQFRGPVASQYLHSLRPQKLQHFRLPHPLSEKWQVFRIDEVSLITEIDEESIVSKASPFDNLDGGPLKFGNMVFDDTEQSASTNNTEDHSHFSFIEFEKSPIAPGYRSYAEIVSRSLEQLISENSCTGSNFPGPLNYLSQQYQAMNNSFDAFSCLNGKPDNSLGSFHGIPNNRVFSGNNLFTHGISSHSPSSPTYLSSILNDAGHQAIAVGNFLLGSEYFNAIHALQKLLPPVSSTSYAQVANDVNSYLIKCLKRDKEKKLRNIAERMNKYEEIGQPYQVFLQFSYNSCDSILTNLNDLRTKIWYMTEVRTSPLWSRARDIAFTLNRGTDGGPGSLGKNLDTPGSLSQSFNPRSHTLKRNSSTTSLSSSGAFSSFKRFTGGSKRDYQSKRQSMSNTVVNPGDAMFAPVEYAGRNKLSDREAEATKKWLDGQQIQNFCTGEERIHRFSCEVDDLVKRVIGDALSGRRNRGQSLLTSSPLFRGDLWKMIVELDGLDRSSGATSSMTGTYPSKASFYNFGCNANGSTNFEAESDLNNRRRSIDSISMEGFSASHMRSKTSTSNHSDLARSYSLRGHKSRKSSPNLIDMFTSSLDLTGKRMSSSDIHIESYDRPSSSNEHLGHRRNRSLNETTSGAGAIGNTSLTGSEDLGAVPEFTDEANRQEHDQKRQILDQFLLDLQMRITSLIYTDLGLEGWSEGSETDKWLCAPIVVASIQYANDRNLKGKSGDNSSLRVNTSSEARASWRHSTGPSDSPNYGSLANHAKSQPPTAHPFKLQFPYEKAYSTLLFQLSVNPSPMGKLMTLYELVRLVVSSLSYSAASGTNGNGRPYRVHSNMPSITSDTQVTATPRTSVVDKTLSRKGSLSAMTSLSEAIATVEAKRISSGAFPAQSPMLGSAGFAIPSVGPSGNRGSIVGPNTDAIAEELRRVFKNAKMERRTLFRDLQFIAAFVPSSVLDLTDMGKAFWDVSLAALSLKEEYLRIVTETASELFKYSTGMLSVDMDSSLLSQWTLQDCAWLWSVASKEGDTEGQRELAIMHLSHPHIAPICLVPFTKLSTVFTPAVLEDYRINEDPEKLDPIRMSIIKHWMTSAAAHGDNIASEYLSQQDFSGYSI